MSELSAIFDKVIHKVPGEPVIPKKEKQGYIELNKMTKVQLLEAIERQNKLLDNRRFLDKLPDKGARITDFKEKLEAELKKRNEDDRLAEMLLNLNVNGPEELNRLEWTGSCNPGFKAQESKPSNAGDQTEVADPLHLFASHSGTQFNKKIYRVEKPDEPLIKQSDLEGEKIDPIEAVFAEEPYVRHLCEKFDDSRSIKPRERFLPHKTLNARPETETKKVKEHKLPIEKRQKWEVTAATPPPPVHGDTKMLSLTDSVRLQCEQADQLKEIQLKHAMDRLKTQREASRIVVPKDTSGWTYRDKDGSKSTSEDESEDDDAAYHDCEEGEGDEADEKQGGVVFYNLVD